MWKTLKKPYCPWNLWLFMGLKGECPTISRDFSKMKDFGLLQLEESEFGLEMKTSHLQEKFGTFIANRNFTQFYANSRNLEVFVKCGRARPIWATLPNEHCWMSRHHRSVPKWGRESRHCLTRHKVYEMQSVSESWSVCEMRSSQANLSNTAKWALMILPNQQSLQCVSSEHLWVDQDRSRWCHERCKSYRKGFPKARERQFTIKAALAFLALEACANKIKAWANMICVTLCFVGQISCNSQK